MRAAYTFADWEYLSTFLTLLIPKLPAPKKEDLSDGVLESVDMESYRLEVREQLSISLADNPVKGFEAAIVDRAELDRLRGAGDGMRQRVSLWSGRSVDIFDFEFPSLTDDSSVVDAGVLPKYRFHLEVQRVVFPATGLVPDQPSMLWEAGSFAVATSKDSAKFEDKPGYFVDPKQCDAILASLRSVLNIDPKDARVLPFYERNRARAGKQISQHPLHETYLGEGKRMLSEAEFYADVPLGALTADLESLKDCPADSVEGLAVETLDRVQRVFTMPFRELFELWEDLAKQWRIQHEQKRS